MSSRKVKSMPTHAEYVAQLLKRQERMLARAKEYRARKLEFKRQEAERAAGATVLKNTALNVASTVGSTIGTLASHAVSAIKTSAEKMIERNKQIAEQKRKDDRMVEILRRANAPREPTIADEATLFAMRNSHMAELSSQEAKLRKAAEEGLASERAKHAAALNKAIEDERRRAADALKMAVEAERLAAADERSKMSQKATKKLKRKIVKSVLAGRDLGMEQQAALMAKEKREQELAQAAAATHKVQTAVQTAVQTEDVPNQEYVDWGRHFLAQELAEREAEGRLPTS